MVVDVANFNCCIVLYNGNGFKEEKLVIGFCPNFRLIAIMNIVEAVFGQSQFFLICLGFSESFRPVEIFYRYWNK